MEESKRDRKIVSCLQRGTICLRSGTAAVNPWRQTTKKVCTSQTLGAWTDIPLDTATSTEMTCNAHDTNITSADFQARP